MERQNINILKILNIISEENLGMTRDEAHEKNICIICKELAIHKCYSPAGLSEYHISGVCEECFDKLFSEEEE